jgi:Na+-transporting NADH:ubiquinone oxidoreductase subunit A
MAETSGKELGMAVHVIRKGLDLPITGAPEQRIEPAPQVARVGILARDYPFMKPRMHVAVGDRVKRGQLLFEDRKTEGVRFTSPGAGKVLAVNRGERRALQSVVIELTPSERQQKAAETDHQKFSNYAGRSVRSLDGGAARALLVESGLWTAVRQRPFSKVPAPSSECHSIFVTAIDTNPLAPDPEVVLEEQLQDFNDGLWVLSTLTEGPVYLCRGPNSSLDGGDAPRVRVEEFHGKHPAGLAGTHIHLLDPVHRSKTVWYVGYQDVVAIGKLFTTGRLAVERIVALGGPLVMRPRLLATRLGAQVEPLLEEEVYFGEKRIISGSVLFGHAARGEVFGFIGRYANQISCLAENRRRHFLGWMMPGFDRFSTVRAYASSLRPKTHRFDFTTTTHGGRRAMIPIGMYERVMPLDMEPTFLLRALVVDDLERAEALGCLELDEEDLGLCSFVSPGKEDFGPALRRNLFELWKEG